MIATRSSHNWKQLPGGFDTVNAKRVYPSDNALGIPDLLPEPDLHAPAWMAPYRTRVRSEQAPEDGAVHFFRDDYRFETVWNRPVQTLESVRGWGMALGPDFSVFTDWPLTIQLWNIHRARWVSRWWQEHGIRVVPTLTWSDERSFDFAFLGVPAGGMVAVSTMGIRKPDEKRAFLAGYREMLTRLSPSLVLCYGPLTPFITDKEEHTPYRVYPTEWASIRLARAQAAQTAQNSDTAGTVGAVNVSPRKAPCDLSAGDGVAPVSSSARTTTGQRTPSTIPTVYPPVSSVPTSPVLPALDLFSTPETSCYAR